MTEDKYTIRDIGLADSGRNRVDWARSNMPILRALKARLAKQRPFRDHRIGICLHVEAKTGVWLETLIAGGARIAITGSPGTTQDDTAAYLVSELGVEVHASRDETFADHMQNARRVLDFQPTLIADNGGDLHYLLGSEEAYRELSRSLRGATEETTTGANRLRETLPAFSFPTIIINDTRAKRIVENRFGVGISVVDGIMRTTNIMLGGKSVLVVGYGYCGQGVAQRLRGLGAHVAVVDREPLVQLEAHLEGFRTGSLDECLPGADIVVTATGRDGVLLPGHYEHMRDGVIVCNAGQNSSEISADALYDMAQQVRELRPDIERLTLPNGKTIFLLARGNLINLAGGDGNPIEVMDLGLAMQTLSLEYLALRAETLDCEPQTVPANIERAAIHAALREWVR